mgnify:FL=1
MVYVQLILLTLLPSVVTCLLYWCNKWCSRSSFFAGKGKIVKEIIFGLVFGWAAVASTKLSVPLGGALVSARDACVLTAGLVFGAPSGLVAGFIGGVGRFLNGDTYTSLGASLTTILAGMVGAALRKWMFDDKRPSLFYGTAIAFVLEVVNMLLVFLTNMQNVRESFLLVESAALPMIAINGFAVLLSMLAVSILSGDFRHNERRKDRLRLAEAFSRWLLCCVVLAFVVSFLFIYGLETRLAYSDAESMLTLYIEDVRDDINDASDENLLALTRAIREEVENLGSLNRAALVELLKKYDVSEISIIDENGIIVESTTLIYYGFDMASGEQSKEFLVLLDGTNELVQRYQTVSHKAGVAMKYAAVTLSQGGFVQVGYNSQRFQRDIDERVEGLTRNRHVGEDGFMLIANNNFNLVSDPNDHEGESLYATTGLKTEVGGEWQLTREVVYGEDSLVMYGVTEGYYIIGVMPMREVVFGRDMSLYTTVFIMIMVFAFLFLLIYFLVKKLVVENIQKINSSLEEITGGNLNVSVDVRTNKEFVSLSDDINSTVQTLKGYIKEAAARIDKELEFARTIQLSTLPSVFPAFPDRTDFDIFATMDTAKEVGGDFYDFYLLDDNRLAFLIADVSGKGISAAMFMMKAKTIIKSHADNESDVALILTRANRDLCENNEAEMFVTCWMGILDFRTNIVTFANAGHNPPLVRHKDGRFEFFKTRPGFVLAGMEGMKYRLGELSLMPGDEIFLYTDGVTEATNSRNELYGDERLEKCLNGLVGMNAKEICRAVKKDVDEFVGEAPQFDDMTMLSLRLMEKDCISLDPKEENMETLLGFVEERLETSDVPVKTIRKMSIAVDEIYSNIRLYSGATTAKVECSVLNSTVQLVFMDNGRPYNPLETKDPDITLSAEEREIGGLGIFMVKKTMDQVTYEYMDGYNRLSLRKSFD